MTHGPPALERLRAFFLWVPNWRTLTETGVESAYD